MKKILLTVLMLALIASFGFAQDLSVGGQFTFDYNISTLGGNFPGFGDAKTTYKTPVLGGSVFFDAAYALANVGYLATVGGTEEDDSFGTTTTSDIEESFTYLTMGLMGKYPIDLDGVTLFPLAGIEYMLNLTAEDKDGNDLKKGATSKEKDSLNQLYVKLGFGSDFDISETLYIRATVLGGYKFRSEFENDLIETMEDIGYKNAYWNTFDVQANLGIGFKL